MIATISELTSSTIMIIDDIPINIRVARAHLETAGYLNFITLSDPSEALTAIRNANPDVLLLDIMMPGISGLEILQALRAEPETQRLPILILTGADSRDLKNQALRLGATDFLTKPIDVDELLPRVRNSLLVKSYEDDLRAQVDQRTAELEQSQNELIHCLARAAEFRDSDTGAHIVRVGKYAAIIADELGMSPEHIARLQQAATLHDVGKIGIPDSILRKEGKRQNPKALRIWWPSTGYPFDRLQSVVGQSCGHWCSDHGSLQFTHSHLGTHDRINAPRMVGRNGISTGPEW